MTYTKSAPTRMIPDAFEKSPLNGIATSTATSMTSLEICQFIASIETDAPRHDNVIRTIKRLVSAGTIQLPPMVEVENKQSLSQNKMVKAYVITSKIDAVVIVAQINSRFCRALAERWEKLENSTHSNGVSLIESNTYKRLEVIEATLANLSELVTNQSKLMLMLANEQKALPAPATPAPAAPEPIQHLQDSYSMSAIAGVSGITLAKLQKMLLERKHIVKVGNNGWRPANTLIASKYCIKTPGHRWAFSQAGAEWIQRGLRALMA